MLTFGFELDDLMSAHGQCKAILGTLAELTCRKISLTDEIGRQTQQGESKFGERKNRKFHPRPCPVDSHTRQI